MKRFMILVEELATSIQGREKLVCEQSARLPKVRDDVMSTVKMEGPMTGMDLLTVASEASVSGKFTC